MFNRTDRNAGGKELNQLRHTGPAPVTPFGGSMPDPGSFASRLRAAALARGGGGGIVARLHAQALANVRPNKIPWLSAFRDRVVGGTIIPEGRVSRPHVITSSDGRGGTVKRWQPREGWTPRDRKGYAEPFALMGLEDSGLSFDPFTAPNMGIATVPTASASPAWWEGIASVLGQGAARIITSRVNTGVAVARAQDINQMNRYGYNMPLPGQSSGISTGTVLAGLAVLGSAYLFLRK